MNKKMVYIVDDESHIREFIEYNLVNNGFDTEVFDSGEAALEKIDIAIPDLIVLDVMLTGIDGFSVCKTLRSIEETRRTPIIMLTAKGEELDRILGLEIGADDYITKPFSIRELISRAKAILRRANVQYEGKKKEGVIEVQDIVIDLNRREIHKGDQLLQLTYKEFELLKMLAFNKGNVLSRDILLDKIWGYELSGETRTVDVHIRHLRKVMGDDEESYIETIRGVGYKLKE